jgi:flagellar protein FliO/FliZ
MNMKNVVSLVGTSAMVLSLSLGYAWAQQTPTTQPAGSPPAVTDTKQAAPVVGEKPKGPAPAVAAPGTPDTTGKAASHPGEVQPKAVEGKAATAKPAEKPAEAAKAVEKVSTVKESAPPKAESIPTAKDAVKAVDKPAVKPQETVAADKTPAVTAKESEKAPVVKPVPEAKVEKAPLQPAADKGAATPAKAGETAPAPTAPKQQ